MNNLKRIIKDKDWRSLMGKYSTEFLAKNLSFIDGLVLSRKLLEDEAWDDSVQTFSIELIKSIREVYPKEWNNDWKHDAYLGYAYDLRGWDYDEQFDAYQRAASKSFVPHPEVLMRLAINWSCPGIYKSKIDEKGAIQLLERALQETPYIEGVECLIDLYDKIGDIKKKEHWAIILKKAKEENLHAPYAFLDFFKNYSS